MRKVEIRDRLWELDKQLQQGKSTRVRQVDERQRLAHACMEAGDHVFGLSYSSQGFVNCCEFCGVLKNASQEQLARNLSVG